MAGAVGGAVVPFLEDDGEKEIDEQKAAKEHDESKVHDAPTGRGLHDPIHVLRPRVECDRLQHGDGRPEKVVKARRPPARSDWVLEIAACRADRARILLLGRGELK
jgi:hypothetical protein